MYAILTPAEIGAMSPARRVGEKNFLWNSVMFYGLGREDRKVAKANIKALNAAIAKDRA